MQHSRHLTLRFIIIRNIKQKLYYTLLMEKDTCSSHNEQIAHESKDYARNIIMMGFTQIATNNLPIEQRLGVEKAVDEVRDKISDLQRELPVEFDQYTTLYLATVEQCKRYFMGNCLELSFMALHYIAENSEAKAEIFYLEGGDHAFLVVGRLPNSDPTDPNTWGEDAYISDPWANKVFSAKHYKEELKSCFRNYTEAKTELVNFSEKEHTVSNAKYEMLNSEQIRKNAESLLAIQNKRSSLVLYSATKYLKKIQQILARLKNKYTEDDAKYKALKSFATSLQSTIYEVSDCIENKRGSFLDQKEALDNLTNKIFSDEVDKGTLGSYRDEDNLKTKFLQKLTLRSKTLESFELAENEVRREVYSVIKR